MPQSSGTKWPCYSPTGGRGTPWQRQNHRTARFQCEQLTEKGTVGGRHTAKEPGAFLAAVQPQPRYNPKPSSPIILRTPRPRKASGLVWRLILRTSRGSRTISPIPIKLSKLYISFCWANLQVQRIVGISLTCQQWSA